MLVPYNGRRPQIHPTAYVHSSAHVIGDVVIGPESSVWFNAVIRGDVHQVRIGARTNIQDNATVHVTRDGSPTVLGDDVTIAHGVIVHGCRIADRCLVGMGAIVMDGADIGHDCLVAAGALVVPGTTVPPGHLLLGEPARVGRALDPEELAHLAQSARSYVQYAANYRSQGIT